MNATTPKLATAVASFGVVAFIVRLVAKSLLDVLLVTRMSIPTDHLDDDGLVHFVGDDSPHEDAPLPDLRCLILFAHCASPAVATAGEAQ